MSEGTTAQNRLYKETSPYLLQHASNPVDWYPWSEEAFDRARNEDKPIFLSVGYSACHWCHVMEHESFEDEEIAELMNTHYINIKVDREERADVDEIYMNAVQIMTQQGGWPMSVFLTPEGKPFYGGTYFPPGNGYGRPGFRQVLLSIADFYKTRRDEVDRAIDGLMEGLNRIATLPGDGSELDLDLISQTASVLAQSFDDRDGGFGSQPKFPNSMSLEVFLRNYARTGQPEDLARVTMTLDRMARGGIYDQLGGGFHRYSVDHKWLVPHFEKMLYDNA
ncbi:MAG TPA: thioredoxin domain-containing protein, partial [Candidatus Latescibacteria bacterium]|nr:thioredoxin domain-containing protein [Candidatus Latescibacterota bacterium]